MQVPLTQPDSTGQAECLAITQGLGVSRSGRWLVRGIDLKVQRGEIVTLIGPNGSGKSTTAKALLGIIAADEGTAKIAEDTRIGYVPQRLATDWILPLTLRRLMTLTGTYESAEINCALSQTGIAHLVDREVRTLSGGEFQRALIARAILRKPDLLILDEPVQGVDFSGEVALYDLIRQFRDELNCGVLLISHDLHIVMAKTDTVVCVNGHMCCSGTPRSVVASPEYRQLFEPKVKQVLSIYHHHQDDSCGRDGRMNPPRDEKETDNV